MKWQKKIKISAYRDAFKKLSRTGNDMMHEKDIIKGRIALGLIKEGSFSIVSWTPVIDGIETQEFSCLLYSIRNALKYATETKTLKGMVKSGFVFAAGQWNNKKDEIDADVFDIGNKAIKAANEFLKKKKIKSEN